MNVTVELSDASKGHWVPELADIENWSRAALECAEHKEHAELSLRFVDVDEGRKLNKDYRGKDYATNVLSFPVLFPEGMTGDSRPALLGDIIICPAVVADEASAQDKKLGDHWAHLVIHGTLHLLGYEHEEETSANLMEGLEIRALQMLGIADPYLVG